MSLCYDEGYDVGYDEGYDVGHYEGYHEGYDAAIAADEKEKVDFFKLLDQLFEYCEVKIDLTNTHQQEIVKDLLLDYEYEVPGIKT